jgi:effector-binding domain-containing protein
MINYGNKVTSGFRLVNGIRVKDDTPGDEGINVDVSTVAVMHRDDRAMILGSRNEWKKGKGFIEPFTRFCQQAEDLRINLSYPISGIHDAWADFLKAPGEPHHFVSMDPTGNHRRKAGNYVVGFVRGYYGEFGDLSERMANFIKENSLTVTGPVYSMYLQDEICIIDPSKFLTQVCVAVD